jgi:hypothetical protein
MLRPLTDAERAVISELLALADMAGQSEDEAIRTFGLVCVRRAMRLIDGHAKLHHYDDDTLEELQREWLDSDPVSWPGDPEPQ